MVCFRLSAWPSKNASGWLVHRARGLALKLGRVSRGGRHCARAMGACFKEGGEWRARCSRHFPVVGNLITGRVERYYGTLYTFSYVSTYPTVASHQTLRVEFLIIAIIGLLIIGP